MARDAARMGRVAVATGKDYIDVGFLPRLPSISTAKKGNASPAATFKFNRKCPEGQVQTDKLIGREA